MTRVPHHSDHDVVVALGPELGGVSQFAYAIAKKTFELGDDGISPTTAVPLQGELGKGAVHERMPAGSDYWWMKRHTDVVVVGSAWAPNGNPITESQVECSVGATRKRVAVFGRRVIEWTTGGHPYIGAPDPFVSMPLIDENAYGGLDMRVPMHHNGTLAEVLALAVDPPGSYPRNPVGKGYLVMPDPLEGFELPNLEDPDDLLTAARLFAHNPRHWHRQPLPWSFGWQHGMSFTRLTRLGVSPRFEPPDPETIEEVKRGHLPPDHAERRKQAKAFDMLFQQEASLGMTFSPLAAKTPISVSGVHPERATIAFSLPEPVDVEIVIDGHSERPPPILTAVVIEPDALRVSFVYVAKTTTLPRKFLPGIHPHIPLSARVDGGPPAAYATPPVMRRASAPTGAQP